MGAPHDSPWDTQALQAHDRHRRESFRRPGLRGRSRLIVHHGNRWVYVGIPKTASTTLHRFLPDFGAELHGHQHETEIPEAWRDYRVIISVMNPYRRATALWRMWGKDTAKGAWWTEGFDPRIAESFGAFVHAFFLDPLEPDGRPVMEWSMCRWLDYAGLEQEPEVLYAESLSDDLLRTGMLTRPEQVPVQNKSGNDSWSQCYDEALVQDVAAWAERDFERFGYPKRFEEARGVDRPSEELRGPEGRGPLARLRVLFGRDS